MKSTLAILVCLLIASAALAQMPKAARADLQPFIGTWDCKGTEFQSARGPEHATRTRLVNDWVLGSEWVAIDARETKTKENPNPLRVSVFLGFDKRTKKLVAAGFDKFGGYWTQEAPGWNGDTITFEGPNHVGEETMPLRDRFVKKSATEFVHTYDFEMNGEWKKLGDETCRKR